MAYCLGAVQFQAYNVGVNSSQTLAARQEVANQLQSPDEAVIPICLVCEKAGDDDAAEKDYNQFGSGEVSLQVAVLYSCEHSLVLMVSFA